MKNSNNLSYFDILQWLTAFNELVEDPESSERKLYKQFVSYVSQLTYDFDLRYLSKLVRALAGHHEYRTREEIISALARIIMLCIWHGAGAREKLCMRRTILIQLASSHLNEIANQSTQSISNLNIQNAVNETISLCPGLKLAADDFVYQNLVDEWI